MATKKKKEYTNVPIIETKITAELDNSSTFMIVNIEDKWRIGMNNRWMTKQEFDTKEAAQTYIDSKPWDLIMNLAGIVAEFTNWMEKKQNNE